MWPLDGVHLVNRYRRMLQAKYLWDTLWFDLLFIDEVERLLIHLSQVAFEIAIQ
jgi:hypothetical protein